jgi:hypothetical protein
VAIIVMLIIAFWLAALLGGCAVKKADKIGLIWAEGADCLLVADGLNVQEAQEIRKDWEFGDCKIGVNESSGQGEKKP